MINNGRGELIITRVEANPVVKKKLRVAAYARVSADKDAAFHSLEAQADYYLHYVKAHAEWELVGIYSDNAISGTTIDRPEFQRLMSDCKAGRIDLIITKSITRFARNTVALLETIRELKALDIDVYFEKEDMHSISPDGELLITLLAMYAEEEARSASENQRWRIKKKFEQGNTTVGRMLGYRLVDGKLTIVPEEAEVVRKIYKSFLNGETIYSIVKTLSTSGIPARYSDTWGASTIRNILTNEKYTGDMLLQKTYTPDFRTKKRCINNGQVAKYQVEGSHEAIISKEDYSKAQELLEQNRKKQRRLNNKNHGGGNNKTDDNSNQPHLFSGLITCGICGYSYRRCSSNTGKYKHQVWSCSLYNNLGKDFCASKAIPECILIEETTKVLTQNIPELNSLPSPLTNAFLKEHIARIIAPSPGHLTYHLDDGRIVEAEWKHRSRSESWTPEMKQRARERTLANIAKRRKTKMNNQTNQAYQAEQTNQEEQISAKEDDK